MALTDAQLDKMLSFDPLASAEDLTGQSYKDDKGTLNLGVGMALLHNDRKRAELAARDDTHFGVSFADALRIYESLGFQQISERKFASHGQEETLTHLWRAGILAQVESYGESINTTKIWYNWRPNLGVGMALLHNDRKRAELAARDDTHFGVSFADALHIYKSLGFEQISERKFASRDGRGETLTHLWRAGILAQVES